MKISIASRLVVLAALCMSACSSEPSETGNSSTAEHTSIEAAQPKVNKSGITIGAFIRGGGPDSAATKAFEQGMELAAEKLAPTVNRTVLVRAQGAATDPAAASLIASGSVPLIVYWETTDVEPVAASLKQSKVLAVPVWNVTKKVARLGTNVFGFGYSTERSFAEYAKFAGKKLKSYRFGVISSIGEPFGTQSRAFIEETKSQGNTVVFDEKAESASSDFSALIARAKKEQCDTIFAVLPGDALVALIKAARAAAYNGKILVGDSFFSTEREALGPDADGVYVLQSWSDDAALNAQYVAKYGVEPDGIALGAAALGYDLIQCIKEAGASSESEAISHAWLSNPCEGLTGKTQFSGERIAQRTKRILTVKGVRFERAE